MLSTISPEENHNINATAPTPTSKTQSGDITTFGPPFENMTWSNWSDYDPWRSSPGASLAAASGIPLDKNGKPTTPLVVGMRMGGPIQHIGTLHKQRLWNAIYNGLTIACPLDKSNCKPSKGDITHKIPNIVYNAKGNDVYATNAYLTLTILHSFHNPAYADMGKYMYEMAATMYVLQTEREENCYWVNFKDSRRTKMCSVGQRLSIGVPANLKHYGLEGLLVIDVEFNGKTTEGDWQCNAGLKQSVHDTFRAKGYDKKIADSVKVDLSAFRDQEVECYLGKGKCEYWFDFFDTTYCRDGD